MGNLLIVNPMQLTASASRGSGAENLASRDPKEIWADTASGSPAMLLGDLGAVREIDTIALIAARPPAASATWSIQGGIAGSTEATIQIATALRVPDVAGAFEETSFALWTGSPQSVRHLAIGVQQPAGQPPLTIGRIIVGKAFVAQLGPEWGGGRRPVDTGSATGLPSGGFSVVEGVRKRFFGWTFGDLSIDEADRLEQIGLALGETLPGFVVEDEARTAGLRARGHYGLFKRWNAYERRNRKQTRWEIGIEEWV